jgi:hypothetical protein
MTNKKKSRDIAHILMEPPVPSVPCIKDDVEEVVLKAVVSMIQEWVSVLSL